MKKNVLVSVLTGIMLFALLFSNFASAIDLNFSGIDTTVPIAQGATGTFLISVDLADFERVPLQNMTITFGNETCVFDISGNNLSACTSITNVRLIQAVGYGYGDFNASGYGTLGYGYSTNYNTYNSQGYGYASGYGYGYLSGYGYGQNGYAALNSGELVYNVTFAYTMIGDTQVSAYVTAQDGTIFGNNVMNLLFDWAAFYSVIHDDLVNDLNVTNNFNEVGNNNVSSFENLWFVKQDLGKINFTDSVDLTDLDFVLKLEDFGTSLILENGEIGMDTSVVDFLNETDATLTLYGLTSTKGYNVKAYADGSNTPLTNTSFFSYELNSTAGTVVINTQHFTTFKATVKSSSSRSDPEEDATNEDTDPYHAVPASELAADLSALGLSGSNVRTLEVSDPVTETTQESVSSLNALLAQTTSDAVKALIQSILDKIKAGTSETVQVHKTLEVYKITLADGTVEYKTKITVSLAGITGPITVTEIIPKTYAQDVANVIFAQTPVVIDADPVVQWKVDASSVYDLSYVVNGQQTLGGSDTIIVKDVVTVPTVITPTQTTTTTAPTTTGTDNNAPTSTGSNLWMWIVGILIVIAIVVVAVVIVKKKA